MPETTQLSDLGDDGHYDGALPVDTILLARYRIIGSLGGGGQGAVYKARDLNFPDANRLVAVKEMHVNNADPKLRSDALKQFRREANILATLSHPAIPKIYDFFDENERAYLVMEYINGHNLEEILMRTSYIPMDKILDWAIALCDVLDYLHNYPDQPIIFRDMKPANIMIDSAGRVRLIDFGIAKKFESNKRHTMIGTEGYSAPEQYKGNANPVSDIYSLGATLHQVITRRDPRLEPPFSFAERVVTDYNKEATPEIAAIIDRSLEFEPPKRYQSCSNMKTDLERLRYRPIASNKSTNNNRIGEPAQMTDFFGEMSEDAGMKPKWTFTVEDEIRGHATAFSNMVFIGSYDTNIWALNLEDGKQLWKRATEGGIATSPIVDAEQKQILFGSEDQSFYALDYREGRLNWTFQTNGKIRGTARLAQGRVFFGSDDGRLYALIAANGNQLWTYDTGGPVRSTPYVTNDRIIFGSDSGEIIGLELNGTKKWSIKVRAGQSVTSSPAVDIEGICYIGASDGHVYAIDAENGYSVWKCRTNGPIYSSPAVDDTNVYVGSADGKLYCINVHTGKERWSFSVDKPIVSSPVVHEGVVYFGGTDNFLYAINAKNGKEIWKFEMKGPVTGKVCLTKDFIIIGSLDHTLYALPLVS